MRKLIVKAIIFIAAATMLTNVAGVKAASGDVDPAFNSGGTGPNGPINAVVVQPDGKIVIGGNFTQYNGAPVPRDIIRLNADGTLDNTFNPGGSGASPSGYTYLGLPTRGVIAMALQPDGKILVGTDDAINYGTAAGVDPFHSGVGSIFRLNPDGTLDDTWNQMTNSSLGDVPAHGPQNGSSFIGSVSAIALQPDGKVLIGGQFTIYDEVDVPDGLIRLNPDGTWDATFNTGGAGFGPIFESGVFALAIQPSGNIIVGGAFNSYNGSAHKNLIRLSPTGKYLNFSYLIQSLDAPVMAIALQVNDTTLIGGDFTRDSGRNIDYPDHIARLTNLGFLDTTFNPGGSGANARVNALAIQPDGKILVGGDFTDYNGNNAPDRIMRLNVDGSRDTTFNPTGAGANGTVNALAIQPDGKILVGGQFTSYNNNSSIPANLIRLAPNPGTLAFSSATYSATEKSGNAAITVKRTGGTDLQVVGKVTLTDVTTSPADYRFNPGARDESFNVGGRGLDNQAYAVAVQPDGKILVGGDFTSYNGVDVPNNLIRLNPDGTIDPTFNPGGVGTNGPVYAIAMHLDGKILVGGQFTAYNNAATGLDNIIQLNADGTEDTDFNFGPNRSGTDGVVYAIAVDSVGKVLIGGDFTSYNNDATAPDRIMRLLPNGSFDTSFNRGTGGTDQAVHAIAIQPDGRILIGGEFTSYNSIISQAHLLRLNDDGTREMTFNSGGTGPNNAVASIIVQPDGKILIGGLFLNYNGDATSPQFILRLNANGTRDTAFNPGGTGADSILLALALQPDGKILIGGVFANYNGVNVSDFITRLNADGTPDAGFNSGAAGAGSSVNALALQPDGKIIIGGTFNFYNGDAAASDKVMRLDGDLFVTWPAGDASDKTIQLPIVNDALVEPDETLNLNLSVVSGSATLGSPNAATLTIIDSGTALSAVSGTGAFGGTATLTATLAGGSGNLSGQTVSFTINSVSVCGGPGQPLCPVTNASGVATLSGVSLAGINAGTYLGAVGAAFAGDANFTASSATGTLSVSKASQTIAVNTHAPSSAGFNSQFTVAATSDSGLAVSYSSSGACTNSGAVFTITSTTGTCTVKYDQAGNSNYNPAAQVIESVTAQKTDQTITFGTLADKTYGDLDFTVSATASSGLSVSFAATGNCALTGTLVQITGAGSCTITASQAGDANTNAAPSVQRTFNINKATPAITWNNPANITYGTALSGTQLNATATVIGTFHYTPASGTILNAGNNQTLSVDFTPSDTANYQTASKTVSINVLKASQTITFSSLAGKTYGDADFTVSATASSGLIVTFAASGNCTISGSTVHLTGAGSCTVTASQGGDSNYNAATAVSQTFSIGQLTLSINNVTQAEGNTGTTAFTFTVTLSAASTLPVAVDYATADGTAVTGSDYQSTNGTLTFNPGDLTKTITVQVNGDNLNEADEIFFVNLTNPQNAALAQAQGTGTIQNDDSPGFQLSASSYSVSEDGGHVAITVNRLGDTSLPATVDYTTSDLAGLAPCSDAHGLASQRCDYSMAVGTLRFAAGETAKTISIPIVDDSYTEGSETFTITLSNPAGTSLSSPASATITINDNDGANGSNPIASADFFIRQLYIDFLGREPEPAGLQGWLNTLNNCAPSSTACDRVQVASAFYRSDEFQMRGYFIYRTYTSLGRAPHYSEFMPDFARVSGFQTDAELEANKTAFVQELMQRPEFKTKYDPTIGNATAYVDLLLQTVGLQNHPQRAAWIDGLTNTTLTRAQVLRFLIDSAELYGRYYNEAFVVEMYFGFLRRDPDALFQQWIQTLNQTGDYRALVSGFLNANEYVRRFGP